MAVTRKLTDTPRYHRYSATLSFKMPHWQEAETKDWAGFRSGDSAACVKECEDLAYYAHKGNMHAWQLSESLFPYIVKHALGY